MEASLPMRTRDAPHFSHTSSSPLNANLGAGEQTNNTQSGGSHNRQISAKEYYENYVAAPVRSETPPLPTHNLPFLRDDDFVERRELLELQLKLATPGKRVALCGLGGVGKSQLAIECCYRLRESSPDTWVLWIHASNAARFDQDIRNLADDVKIRGRDDKNANIFELVRGWLNDSRKGWLMVLDNADEAEFLFERPSVAGDSGASTADTAGRRYRLAYLPVCSHGSILVTTRSRTVAAKFTDSRRCIYLQPNEEHAISLLKTRLEHHEDDAYLIRLAAALEHMPLAVSQAAAYINKRAPHCSIQTYLAKLERSERSRWGLLGSSMKELRRDSEAKDSILLTWQISFEHIYNTQRGAANLLSLLSFFDHQGIPEVLVRAGVTSDRSTSQPGEEGDATDNSSSDSEEATLDDAIDVLRDYSFISVRTDESAFEMHRLVQVATQMWLKETEQYQQWETQSLLKLDATFPIGEHENKDKCRALYPQVRLVLKLKPKAQDALLSLASVLYKSAWFTLKQGLYLEAETAAKRSLEVRESTLTETSRDTLDSLVMLALVLRYQGSYEAAEEMNRRALEGSEKVLGKEHPDTLTSVDNLALVLQGQGKYEAAEEMNRRALEGYEKVLGKEHPDTLTSVGNLALVLQGQGKYEAAEEMNRRALEGRENVLGKEHPSTLTSVSNLALVLQRQGKYEAAEEMNRRALEGYEKVLGKEHPDTLTSVSNLASVLQYQGKYEAAEEMNRRALEGYEKVLGKEHPDTLTSVGNLASVLRYQGKYEAAEEMNRRALEGRENVLGKEHPDTLTSVDNLALVLQGQGKYEAAEEMNRRALEGYEKVLGKEHPDTLTSVDNLALVLQGQGKYEAAEEMNRRALEGYEKVLGKEHPDTLTSVSNLALVLQRQGKYEAAEEMNRRALKGYEKVLGKEHPDTLTSMANLAITYRDTGRILEAERLMTACVEGRNRALGVRHPFTQASSPALKAMRSLIHGSTREESRDH